MTRLTTLGWAILFLVLLGLAALSTTQAAEAGTYSVPNSMSDGGKWDTYTALVDELDERGDFVEIRVRNCTSACTVFLLAKKMCTDPETRYHFHGPSARWTWATFIAFGIPWPDDGLSDEKHAWAVDRMAEVYNSRVPGLGDWFKERAAHKFGLGVVTVRGAELNRVFLIPLCGE